jgi:hypothetical protein
MSVYLCANRHYYSYNVLISNVYIMSICFIADNYTAITP